MQSDMDMFVRIITSCILGGLIGLERERGLRPAGFRTHILVCTGATLITLVSIYGFVDSTGVRDPARIAAQIVSGIGFLGAGTILNKGSSVKGLTTAASLWIVAGIGMATGAGMLKLAAGTTLLVLIVLLSFAHLERAYKIFRPRTKGILKIVATKEGCNINTITSLIEEYEATIKSIEVHEIFSENLVVLEVLLISSEEDINDILTEIVKMPCVEKITRLS
ncbi:MgtC/SapB family protein [Succinispira mobilis]|uniref:MgtC/SapB family protein n=1 Tax=Succinispira mobilis TaxID=78120 RepID=UPI000367E513|nr:MgtC/SapB family protein [Succinispira mobilis]